MSSAKKVETRSQKQFRMRKINKFFPKLSKKDNSEKSQKRPLQETEDEPYLSHSESSESHSSSEEEFILPGKKNRRLIKNQHPKKMKKNLSISL